MKIEELIHHLESEIDRVTARFWQSFRSQHERDYLKGYAVALSHTLQHIKELSHYTETDYL